MNVSCDGRVFRTVVNAETGDVTTETLFTYHQHGKIVWATYEGAASLSALWWRSLPAMAGSTCGTSTSAARVN
jgi:hypothetical protein